MRLSHAPLLTLVLLAFKVDSLSRLRTCRRSDELDTCFFAFRSSSLEQASISSPEYACRSILAYTEQHGE